MLQLEFVVVHWDQKLFPEISEREKVDRFPVILCKNEKEYLRRIPELSSGCGVDIAAGVYDILTENQFLDNIEAI